MPRGAGRGGTDNRREGYPQPYEALKQLTRGQAITLESLDAFIDTLDIGDHVKAELRALTPEIYIGRAVDLVRTLRDA